MTYWSVWRKYFPLDNAHFSINLTFPRKTVSALLQTCVSHRISPFPLQILYYTTLKSYIFFPDSPIEVQYRFFFSIVLSIAYRVNRYTKIFVNEINAGIKMNMHICVCTHTYQECITLREESNVFFRTMDVMGIQLKVLMTDGWVLWEAWWKEFELCWDLKDEW